MNIHIRKMSGPGRSILLLLMAGLYSSVSAAPCSFIVRDDCSCTSEISLININCTFDQSTNQTSPLITSSLSKPITIQELNLSKNNLTEIPPDFFQSVQSILELDLSFNSFNKIPKLFDSMRNITILNISHNQVDTLYSSSLSEMSLVRVLDLSNNRISMLEETTENNLKLHILNLSHNLITTVPNMIWTTTQNLDLGHNKITSLKQLPDSQIKYLTLTGNQLETIPKNTFSQLHFLDELNLGDNKIKSISVESFYGAWALTELDLSGNLLRVLANGQFKTLPNLITLKLGGNSIRNINRTSFIGIEANLQRLSLQENRLTNISHDSFKDLENLRYLDLSSNPSLGDVNEIQFPAHLASLDLSQCNVQHINDCRFAKYMDLQFLGLSGNNLSCSCHLSWLFRWQKNTRLYVYFSANRNEPHWKCLDENNKLVSVTPDMPGCANNTAHRKHCDKLQEIHINPDLINIEISVSASSEKITAVWELTSEYSIHGIIVTYRTTDDTYFESPLLLSTATSYMIKDTEVKGSYTVCIHALFNETYTIKEKCQTEDDSLIQMVVGILAGVIFMIPCVAALVYILYKDYKVMNSEEYQQLDHVESSRVISHEHKTEVKVIPSVEVKNNLPISKEISSTSTAVELVLPKTVIGSADNQAHSNEAFDPDYEQIVIDSNVEDTLQTEEKTVNSEEYLTKL